MEQLRPATNRWCADLADSADLGNPICHRRVIDVGDLLVLQLLQTTANDLASLRRPAYVAVEPLPDVCLAIWRCCHSATLDARDRTFGAAFNIQDHHHYS